MQIQKKKVEIISINFKKNEKKKKQALLLKKYISKHLATFQNIQKYLANFSVEGSRSYDPEHLQNMGSKIRSRSTSKYGIEIDQNRLRTWKDWRSANHWINPSTVTWWWIVIEYRGHRFLRRVFFNIFWSCWRWGRQSSKFNCNAKSSFWSLNWFLRSFFFYGRSLKGRWYSE